MHRERFTSALTSDEVTELRRRAHLLRGSVLTATSVAGSGHPGGSFSSAEVYTVLYGCANLRPNEPGWDDRDRIVVSHGHTSPGAYCALAYAGFFEPTQVEAHFRQAGSVFEGHVERAVPGVEWSTGNLGQGLSAGVGMALGARLTRRTWRTYVVMSDGEQHKGQVSEARRLAVKQGLCDLTVIVDLNGVQISGHTADIMPVDVAADFAADGWRVVRIDGHSIEAVYDALAQAEACTEAPVCIIAETVIGKGVSFMEDDPEFHGRGLTAPEYAAAMAELGLEPRLESAHAMRDQPCLVAEIEFATPAVNVEPGTPRRYGIGDKTDNRSAWGAALADLARSNPDLPVAVLDCDLMTSVKTQDFAAQRPDAFIQCGVGEHNAATVTGALSVSGVLAFWADFGVFGCDEVYNQQRLNDINGAAAKVVLTHCGLDVGEDGKTHQCLDYVGALRNFFGWRVIVPADPNQTDAAVRAAAAMRGNVCIAMGRSKLPVISAQDGMPLFGADYEFTYGDIAIAREGEGPWVLAMGTIAGAAVRASDALAAQGRRFPVAIVASPLHLDMAFMERAAAGKMIFTVEDHSVHTGLGASVAEWLSGHGSGTRLVRLGVDRYHSSGAASDLLAGAGLDVEGIAASLRELAGS
ncbi:MAG: transketolase [Actinobacteria bacterium HGW-Actinobacteria-10]|jgi:transketolase|nr:MAG: transketolase [Actinobacteria bacterium HGW-Actinobacteria-10]